MAKYPVQMAFSMCLQIVSDTLYGNYRTILHEMENSSNFSGYEEQRGNLDVYGFLKLANGGLYLFLSISTIIALLCTTKSVAKGLKMYLISILVSGILISMCSILTSLVTLVTVFSAAPAPTPIFCRMIIWMIGLCNSARCFCVAGFSIMVLVVVRYGNKNLNIIYITLSLCALWGLSLLIAIPYQEPQVLAVTFTATGSVCISVQDDTIVLEAQLIITAFRLTINTVIPLLICIVASLIVFRYLKGHNITGNINCGKAVAKLALFILTGSLINSISTIIITVLLHFTTESGVALSYIISAIGLLSLYPTPILILMFLKPVRNKLKALLKCKCLHGHPSLAEAATMSLTTANMNMQSLVVHQ